MRRRWMSAILALTMALALTACGGDSSSSSSNDSTPAESTPRRSHRGDPPCGGSDRHGYQRHSRP